ncbi:MAG: hypothetical protein J3Q66DRAFT_400949 [Benniella sp.]|nr:MAG: hypothetical protein J3Q66DRAFT_400949 [Benniella sp.]
MLSSLVIPAACTHERGKVGSENQAKRAAEDPILGLRPLKQRKTTPSQQPGELGNLKSVVSKYRLAGLIDMDLYEQASAAIYFTTYAPTAGGSAENQQTMFTRSTWIVLRGKTTSYQAFHYKTGERHAKVQRASHGGTGTQGRVTENSRIGHTPEEAGEPHQQIKRQEYDGLWTLSGLISLKNSQTSSFKEAYWRLRRLGTEERMEVFKQVIVDKEPKEKLCSLVANGKLELHRIKPMTYSTAARVVQSRQHLCRHQNYPLQYHRLHRHQPYLAERYSRIKRMIITPSDVPFEDAGRFQWPYSLRTSMRRTQHRTSCFMVLSRNWGISLSPLVMTGITTLFDISSAPIVNKSMNFIWDISVKLIGLPDHVQTEIRDRYVWPVSSMISTLSILKSLESNLKQGKEILLNGSLKLSAENHAFERSVKDTFCHGAIDTLFTHHFSKRGEYKLEWANKEAGSKQPKPEAKPPGETNSVKNYLGDLWKIANLCKDTIDSFLQKGLNITKAAGIQIFGLKMTL